MSEASAASGDLRELLIEGHAALSAPPVARVSEALTVLPKLVAALDRVCLYQHELRDVRKELTIAVSALRTEVRTAQRQHPEVTYRSAQVQTSLKAVTELLDKLDRLVFSE